MVENTPLSLKCVESATNNNEGIVNVEYRYSELNSDQYHSHATLINYETSLSEQFYNYKKVRKI